MQSIAIVRVIERKGFSNFEKQGSRAPRLGEDKYLEARSDRTGSGVQRDDAIRTRTRFLGAVRRYRRYRARSSVARLWVMSGRVLTRTRKGGNGQKGRDDG